MKATRAQSIAVLCLLAVLPCALAQQQLEGRVVEIERIVPILGEAEPVYHVQRADPSPTVDGNLAEWKDVPAMVLDNEGQQAASLQAR